MNINTFLAATAVLALAGGAAQAATATPGVTLNDATGQQLGNGPFTLGFEFQANTAIKVGQLGVFDDAQDGLNESHDVGLWDAQGNLLASTTIAAGTGANLINQFRYNSIAPVTLSAGQDYFLGAVWADGADPLVFSASNLATAPQISYLAAAYVSGGSLSDPVNTYGGTVGYFGPNLTLSAVPEPATWGMMLMGFGGLGAVVRGSRRGRTAVAV